MNNEIYVLIKFSQTFQNIFCFKDIFKYAHVKSFTKEAGQKYYNPCSIFCPQRRLQLVFASAREMQSGSYRGHRSGWLVVTHP